MSRKNVDVWANYNLGITKKEVQNSTLPQIQNSESSQLQTSEIVKVQTSEISETQNSETPKFQTSEDSNIENYKITKLQNSSTPEFQTSEITDVQSSESSQFHNSTIVETTIRASSKNGKKRKLSYRDMGWEQLTSYLSPRARKKLGDKSHKEKKDISLILDELILNNL
jgi:hypothetical protein